MTNMVLDYEQLALDEQTADLCTGTAVPQKMPRVLQYLARFFVAVRLL